MEEMNDAGAAMAASENGELYPVAEAVFASLDMVLADGLSIYLGREPSSVRVEREAGQAGAALTIDGRIYHVTVQAVVPS